MTDNQLLVEEELEVLESIYPDYILESNPKSIQLEIPVELDTPRAVSVLSNNLPVNSPGNGSSMSLSYLPPIILGLQLPNGYPSDCPPIIASLHATHSWLPSEAQLVSLLTGAWTEGECVLCNWVELVRSGEFLDRLRLVDHSGHIRLPHTGSHSLLPQHLVEYDARVAARRFSQTSYPCSICFTSLKGVRCIQLECSHVFCRDCLRDFWSLCITEGSVERVGCADPACVKEGRAASEEEVRRVVSDREIIRWKWLRTKKEIEKDPTIVHCPIPTCQAAVPKPSADPNASAAWDRFRSCPACGFNFCSFCKHTWHGPISACPKSVTLAAVMEYLDLPEGSPERAALERQFGRSTLLKLVKEYEEEKSTVEWLQNSTTTCPGCSVPVEKSVGCNHMMCVKCNQHFCYRCGAKLSASNPYAHFSARGAKCYGKLFDFNNSSEEDGWQRVEWFEAL
ncbi:hypothetical protein ACEPAG_1088 [Sanghuangporus baumii]